MRFFFFFVLFLCSFVLLHISCAPPIDLTGWPCGANEDCGAEHLCSAGFCERTSIRAEAKKPSIILFVVGTACRTQSACRGRSNQGVGKKCKVAGSNGERWPGGYCTLQCKLDTDCNPDTVPGNKAFCYKKAGQKEGECRKKCDIDNDCRVSYVCQKASSHLPSMCIPSN